MDNTHESFDGQKLDALADEYMDRVRRGERPSIDEYAARHPELAKQIRECFPVFARLEGLKDAPGDALPPRGAVPDRIGEYRIIREVGRGGMGIVYEAEQESLGRRVALKVLPERVSDSTSSRERFQREARAAAGLHHTNIVPVFEVGREADHDYYAMQLIRGHGLDQIIVELRAMQRADVALPSAPDQADTVEIAESLHSGDFPDPTPLQSTPLRQPSTSSVLGSSVGTPSGIPLYRAVARIARQVAQALDYAHSRGVIHRDIKPSNLLLDRAGEVWVTDFGLAKTEDADLTQTGEVVGTLRYMAPERFAGECHTSADIYAIGATLYELVTLQPAFVATDRIELIEQIANREPVRPRLIVPQIPLDLDTIITIAMSKNPRHRYASAKALAADLQRFVENRPILARRTSAGEKLRRWALRNPALSASLTGVIVLLLALIVFSYVGMRIEQTQRLELQRRWYHSEMVIAGGASATPEGRPQIVRLLKPWRAPERESMIGWELGFFEALVTETDVVVAAAPGIWKSLQWGPGDSVLVGDGAGRLLELDGGTGEVLRRAHDHPAGLLTAIAASPDGRRLLTVDWKGKGVVRDAHSWEIEYSFDIGFEAHSASWNGASDHFVVSGVRPNTTRVFALGSDEPVRDFPGCSVASFRPDTSQLCTFESDDRKGVLRVWTLAGTEPLATLRGAEGPTQHILEWQPGGELLAAFGWNRALLIDLSTMLSNERFEPDPRLPVKAPYRVLQWKPDGSAFATGEATGVVRIFDADSGRELRSFSLGEVSVTALAWSRDGRMLAAASEQELRIWSLDATPAVREIGTGLGFDPDEPARLLWSDTSAELIAVSLWSQRIHVGRGAPVEKPIPFTAFAWIDDDVWGVQLGDRQVTRRRRGTAVAPWAAATGVRSVLPTRAGLVWVTDSMELWGAPQKLGDEPVRLAQLGGENEPITAIQASPAEDRVLIVQGRWMRGLSLPSMDELFRTRLAIPGVRTIEFSPDGARFVTLSRKSVVHIRDTANGAVKFELIGHTQEVLTCAYHPDGSRLATGSRDGTLRLWDPRIGELVTVFDEGESVNAVAWSPDGNNLAAFLGSGVVRIRAARAR